MPQRGISPITEVRTSEQHRVRIDAHARKEILRIPLRAAFLMNHVMIDVTGSGPIQVTAYVSGKQVAAWINEGEGGHTLSGRFMTPGVGENVPLTVAVKNRSDAEWKGQIRLQVIETREPDVIERLADLVKDELETSALTRVERGHDAND